MSVITLDNQLDLLELQFKEVASALVDGNPDAVQSAGARLQQLAVGLVQMADEVGRNRLAAPLRTQRIKALAKGLPALRENLLRRAAYVDRALEIVVPTAPQSTYVGRNTYGSAVRQSGTFNVLSA